MEIDFSTIQLTLDRFLKETIDIGGVFFSFNAKVTFTLGGINNK